MLDKDVGFARKQRHVSRPAAATAPAGRAFSESAERTIHRRKIGAQQTGW
jgi:hypothetical protein